MIDIVFRADSYEIVLAEAKALGFTYTDGEGAEHIIASGPLKSGGSYYLNYVGFVYKLPINLNETSVAYPGVWGRLRVNGAVSDLPKFSSAITQYIYSPDANGWIDSVTGVAAPDYIENIGTFA